MKNVHIVADTAQNLTSMVVGIASLYRRRIWRTGSVGVGLVKSTTTAEIGSTADIYTTGSVQLHAGDDTDIFMMERAASFSGQQFAYRCGGCGRICWPDKGENQEIMPAL